MSAICTCHPFTKNTEHFYNTITIPSSSSSSCSLSICSIIYPTSIRTSSSRRRTSLVLAKSSGGGAELSTTKLPENNKPLYAHSLPCLEEWLKSLAFRQSKDDRSVWFVEKPDWHAHLSLDVTDLHIRYLKTGPGNLEKDIERRFSYALSREDVENAILGGP